MNLATSTYIRPVSTTYGGHFTGFTFSGKERDEETGYSYFGARYYDAELTTMWLSVDPMADKYPGMSPYNYCSGNPVKLVDPDGKEISTHTDIEGNVVAVYNDGDNGVYRHNGDRAYTKCLVLKKVDSSKREKPCSRTTQDRERSTMTK